MPVGLPPTLASTCRYAARSNLLRLRKPDGRCAVQTALVVSTSRRLSGTATIGRTAFRPCFLDRRAWHVAVRTEDAAVAFQGPQDHGALRTVIKELTGVGGHYLDRDAATLRAGQRRGKLHHAPSTTRISGASIYPHIADAPTKADAQSNANRVARVGRAVEHVVSRAQDRARRM